MKFEKPLLAIAGVVTATLLCILALANSALFYHLTNRAIDKFMALVEPKDPKRYAIIRNDFNLSFESPAEAKVFDTQNSQMEISNKFASKGTHSLMVEFPPEVDCPGIYFEVYGKDCFDWSDLEEFSFDVYNSIAAEGQVYIQIRSGEQYPKREFKDSYPVSAQAWTTVHVKRAELEHKVDLSKISHLTIFMSNATTTYRMYFDNMRVVRENAQMNK